MTIPPFVAGVLVTVFAEIVVINVIALVSAIKARKNR